MVTPIDPTSAAFLLAVLTLPALFWLVMLKRTTVYTAPEEWLMTNVVEVLHAWVQVNVPPLETLIIGTSALGSGWFVALAFAGLGQRSVFQPNGSRRDDDRCLIGRFHATRAAGS